MDKILQREKKLKANILRELVLKRKLKELERLTKRKLERQRLFQRIEACGFESKKSKLKDILVKKIGHMQLI